MALIMPMRDEAAFLPDTLASIQRQTFDKSHLCVLAVDGESTDGTAQLVRQWLSRTGIPGKVLTNPQRSIPAALNIGLRHAGPADFIVRLDAHTVYGPTYIADIVATFATAPADVACVGGAQIPAADSNFQRAIVGQLLTHPLGLARIGVRNLSVPIKTDTVYLGAWRPGVLQRAGGFDETWIANEDSELEARLRSQGWKLLMIPTANFYKVNRGLAATIRQWAKYGYWRAQTTRRYPRELRPRHVIPPLSLAAGVALLFTPRRYIDIVLFALYSLGILAFRDRDVPLVVTLGCCLAFPVIQIVYTIGFVRGRLTKPHPFVPAVFDRHYDCASTPSP